MSNPNMTLSAPEDAGETLRVDVQGLVKTENGTIAGAAMRLHVCPERAALLAYVLTATPEQLRAAPLKP